MKDIGELIIRLEKNGFPIEEELKFALKTTEIQHFIKSGCEQFFSDNPVEFMKTSKGITKNISAPHMLVILLHHLEIKKGQKVLLVGSKGGYLAAILDNLLGEEGIITLIVTIPSRFLPQQRTICFQNDCGHFKVLSFQ